jgi:hypothetical protein
MTTLATVLGLLQTAMSNITGIKYAPDYPTEQAAQFPYVVTFPVAFRGQVNTPEDFRMLYDIRVELHIAHKDLYEDVKRLLDFPEAGANALFNALVDNNQAHEGIEGGFGKLEWGDTETIGFWWTVLGVKIVTTIT